MTKFTICIHAVIIASYVLGGTEALKLVREWL